MATKSTPHGKLPPSIYQAPSKSYRPAEYLRNTEVNRSDNAGVKLAMPVLNPLKADLPIRKDITKLKSSTVQDRMGNLSAPKKSYKPFVAPKDTRAVAESTSIPKTKFQKITPGDGTYQRKDTNYDVDTQLQNQKFANSLNPFGYLPNGMNKGGGISGNIKALKDRAESFGTDMRDSNRSIADNVSPNTQLDLTKDSHRRRLDANKMYLGLPQKTFIPSAYKPDSPEAYPVVSFRDQSLTKKYKSMALDHGLLSKFEEAEKAGKDVYFETTHDDNAVSNAFTIGIKRDKQTGKPYVFHRDLWDLSVNPADKVASWAPESIRSSVQSGASKFLAPVTEGVKGKPYVLYGRDYIDDNEFAKYSKTKYRRLPDDQTTVNGGKGAK